MQASIAGKQTLQQWRVVLPTRNDPVERGGLHPPRHSIGLLVCRKAHTLAPTSIKGRTMAGR